MPWPKFVAESRRISQNSTTADANSYHYTAGPAMELV